MTRIDLGWVGIWLLLFSAVVIVVEGVVAAIWTVRLVRRANELSRRVASEQAAIQKDLARLRAAVAETAILWQPYARILRFLNHPLVIALMQSYARRRASAR